MQVMSKNRLSPLQRAYRLGYLRAFNKCRADLHALAANFDAEIAALRNEFTETVADIRRFRDIERALDAERDFDALLN
jgi:hypothetical protein